jgi:hypothetical protein
VRGLPGALAVRRLPGALAVALIGLVLVGCGGERKGAGSAANASAHAGASASAPAGGDASAGVASVPGGVKGDEDDDDTNGANNPSLAFDKDLDRDNDSAEEASSRSSYYDNDDGYFRYFGHPASAADEQAIKALVRGYYAAAAAEDGAKACALSHRFLANKVIPEDEGRNSGPSYLHGLTTCPAILTRLFKHIHNQIAAAVQVVAVRVKGDEARALFGSRTTPAEFTEARREGAAWKISRVLGSRLP